MLNRTEAATATAAHDFAPDADSIPFRKSMLAQLGASGGTPLVAHHARGDAMMPTFGDGDLLLVDVSVRAVESDGLYLVTSGGGIHEKRISVNPVTRQLTLRSDNPLYPVWPDCPPDQVTVLGRIIWQGRRL